MARDQRVGVLGAGHIGSVHIQTLTALDEVSQVAVADVVPENRNRAERLGAQTTYEEYEDLIAAEALDAVVIALPPFLHADAARRAAEAGCDMFVEKPLARSVAEARTILDAAEEAGVAIGVDHTLRYQPDIRTLKETYDDGSLGHVPIAYASRVNSGPFEAPPSSSGVPAWKIDPVATGGGATIGLGIHLLDVLEWIFGDLEVRHAELSRQLELEYEDTASVVLESGRTGTTAIMNCGYFQWENPPDANMTVRLDGVTGTVHNEEYVPNFYLNAARSALVNAAKRIVGKDPDYYRPSYYYQAHFSALAEFLDASADGRTPPVSGEDGLRALELVEEAYEVADFAPQRYEIDPAVDSEDGHDTATAEEGP